MILHTWTSDQETILECVRSNCLYLCKCNKKYYIKLTHSLTRYKLPVIILSAINSVWIVGVTRYYPEHVITSVSCIISLIVGIIGSLQMYYQIEKKLEITSTSTNQFYNLAIDIFRQLSLDRERRDSNGSDYLSDVYNRYIAISDNSLIMNYYSRSNIDHLFQAPSLRQNQQLMQDIALQDSDSSMSDSV